MRIGVNPEKGKSHRNSRKFHRIIIPVFIPNDSEDYYRESFKILQSCLNSLFKTINQETTGITVVNNYSFPNVSKRLSEYLNAGLIDKHVEYKENRGKVYAVLSEARASYESFVTIADADVLFFSGWEKAVFEIFKVFPKAGVVSPLPLQNLAFNKNYSVFFDNYLLNKIRYDKVVSDEDCNLFLKGMGNTALLRRNNREHSWKERQYFLKKDIAVVVGAGHFVSTYRREIFNSNLPFPDWKFKNGFEDLYLDEPADKLGWYRLSTPSSFAYHVGNKSDDILENVTFDPKDKVDKELFCQIPSPSKSKVPYWIKSYFFKGLKKYRKL